MMMVGPAMADFIAHLPFMKSDGTHQTQLLEHREIAIYRHEISLCPSLDQARMYLCRRNRECALLQNGENGLSGLRNLLPARLEALTDRSFHITSYMQVGCIYQLVRSHVKQPCSNPRLAIRNMTAPAMITTDM